MRLDWGKTPQDPTICCLQKTCFRLKAQVSESKRVDKIYHANNDQKRSGVAILTSDKIVRTKKNVTGDKEGIYNE